jgi:hypothetical protein
MIINNKYIRDNGFELFENEWKNYKQNLDSVIDEMISKTFLLIPFNLEDMIEGILFKIILKIRLPKNSPKPKNRG